MTECKNCGSYVTARFARVFGNNEREVFGCPRCSAFADLMDGSASAPNP
ncbi:MAG: hypothetical protein R3324_19670 [Halobacteriales archaeon]|nr:hypothetical protein [Halobacteriales archaeon]